MRVRAKTIARTPHHSVAFHVKQRRWRRMSLVPLAPPTAKAQGTGLGAAHRRSERPVVAVYGGGMTRILVTGMSGVGKSTLLTTLNERGHLTIDTDYGNWKTAAGLWDHNLMTAALSSHTEVIVAGTVENQGDFYDQFDHIVLLSAPLPVILQRVMHRTANPYGKTAAQRAEIEENLKSVEPLLRRGATMELDASRSTADIARTIEALLATSAVSRGTTSNE